MNEEGEAMRVCGLVGFICALILLTGDTVSAQDLKFFEGHAVKSNGTGAKKLKFTDTDATNTEEFVNICRSICEDGDADGKNGSCGGFVVNYTNRSKSTPKHCVFKKEGSQPYRKSSKDTYLINTNHSPALDSIGNKSVAEGSALSFDLSGSDADDDALSYSVSGNPSGSSMSGTTFNWTPGSSDAGSHTMTFSVSDGNGGIASEAITITVNNVVASACQNAGIFNAESETCDCYSGYDGNNCENEALCNQLNKQKALYVHYEYDPPLTKSNLFDVSAEISWTDINHIDEYGRNGIYEAHAIKMGQDGPGGYFGAQIKGNHKEDMLLFSIWDSRAGNYMVWPMHGNCNRNCNDCGSAHSGGTGVKCSYDLPMDQGERYTMRIHRTTEQGTYTAEAETYTGPVWQVSAMAEGSDEEIIVGEILFQDLDPDKGLSRFDLFHEHLGCTRCASFHVKVGRKDPVIHSPTTTALVGVSGSVNCPDCSCDLYNITRQDDSIFFETGPGTEPDFARSERIELSGE